MKDDLNDEVPNGTPKTLIPFNGVLNWDGVSKSSGKPKGVTHFLGWIKLHRVQSKNVHMQRIQWKKGGGDDVNVIYNGWK